MYEDIVGHVPDIAEHVERLCHGGEVHGDHVCVDDECAYRLHYPDEIRKMRNEVVLNEGDAFGRKMNQHDDRRFDLDLRVWDGLESCASDVLLAACWFCEKLDQLLMDLMNKEHWISKTRASDYFV